MSQNLLAYLQYGLIRIATIPPRVLASPPSQPRRASVALILRVRPSAEDEPWLKAKWQQGEVKEEDAHYFPSMTQQDANGTLSIEARLRHFFSLPWVQRGTAELLFIKRAVRENDQWSSHVAFPGGRRDEEDESGLYTAMRETWEEVGLDLAEKEFLQVGHLEDREITSSLGKRLLMILSPYVFLQLSPFSETPHLQASEVESIQWVELNRIFTPSPQWGSIHMDFARHAPRNSAIRWVLTLLIGKMTFRCIELPNRPMAIAGSDDQLTKLNGQPNATTNATSDDEQDNTRLLTTSEQDYLEQCTPHLQLWGLTLGMTLDFLAHMATYQMQSAAESQRSKTMLQRLLSYTPSSWVLAEPDLPAHTRLAPSIVEVFPHFSYPDVNFWIWVFGWRYRVILRGWRRSLGTEMERRAHWSGLALAAF
ncbi:hypothetical protein MYAM1_003141 [Malassezia yamatoensis]|uniref:Nudix hydrolase domain-containing protein n=1 Tax=Malassezia yamatoensis TaxID=253288 RepID=A0AAJ6CK63_9BASI|nr:hypothetical protein MYAM1_003141 [Malassezia yamatoensis]